MSYIPICRLNEQAERVMLYTENTLSKRMRLPVDIDDTTAKLIAAAVLYRGRGGDVWLNGEKVNLSNIRLKLKAEFQHDIVTH